MLQSPNSPEAYADLILAESGFSEVRRIDRRYPRLDDMVQNYSEGILRLLDS
jgi:hypothetical protein